MCTVSWLHKPGGYHLFCNRDEKRTRGIATPPRLIERGGLRYIAPADSDFGGTWIAVNEYGLGLSLLNGGGPGGGAQSRGLVIPEVIWARSLDDCEFLLRHLDLTPFAPFTMVMIEPDSGPAVAVWDGERLALDPDARAPLTSSSYEPESVRRERLRAFDRRMPSTPKQLYQFHASHSGTTGAHAPCMHRPDAETVSFSHVVVTADEIRFAYLPSSPCRLESPWDN